MTMFFRFYIIKLTHYPIVRFIAIFDNPLSEFQIAVLKTSAQVAVKQKNSIYSVEHLYIFNKKEVDMILVRDIFQLKFGKAKDAKVLIKEMSELDKKFGNQASRILTDLTGPYYTLVMESVHESLTAYEQSMKNSMGAEEFGRWYQKFVLLVESGKREIFTILEQ
jgi:hypothetical protein